MADVNFLKYCLYGSKINFYTLYVPCLYLLVKEKKKGILTQASGYWSVSIHLTKSASPMKTFLCWLTSAFQSELTEKSTFHLRKVFKNTW